MWSQWPPVTKYPVLKSLKLREGPLLFLFGLFNSSEVSRFYLLEFFSFACFFFISSKLERLPFFHKFDNYCNF